MPQREMQNHPPCVVRKAEANLHGDLATGVGCLGKGLIDLISPASILADECVGSANSNFCANAPLFDSVKHANVAHNVAVRKKNKHIAVSREKVKMKFGNVLPRDHHNPTRQIFI